MYFGIKNTLKKQPPPHFQTRPSIILVVKFKHSLDLINLCSTWEMFDRDK